MDEILQFFSDNKDALTAIGIILTFGVSIVSLYFSIRNNKAVHYVNSITKSRIEWIQKLRKTVADFIAKTNVYNNVYYMGDFDKSGEHLSECQMLCSEIKLLLNCFDAKDKKICMLLDEILEGHRKYTDSVHNMEVDEKGYFVENNDTKKIKNNIEKNIKLLMKEMHIYLKSEWNRVKYESQGKTYEKETQIFDIWELEQKYDNPEYKNNVWKRFCINSKAKARRIWNSFGFSFFIFCIGMAILIFSVPQLVKEILDAIPK